MAAQSANPPEATQAPSARVTLTSLDVAHFPTISARFEAYDSQGNFLPGLTADSVRVLEDGEEITPSGVETAQNNLQICVALSLGAQMQYPAGDDSVFNRVRRALLTWANAAQSVAGAPGAGEDDLSLSTATGMFLIRSKNPSEWSKALTEYEPDWAKVKAGADSLTAALNLAAEPDAASSTRHVVLFITPALEGAAVTTITHLTDQAQQAGVKVFVWYISGTEGTEAPAPLKQLAEQTGGKFFDLKTAGTVPDFSSLLSGLRNGYALEYASKIRKGGSHTLSIRLNSGEAVEATPRSFTVNLQQPNPIFLSPPESIHRTWQAGSSNLAELSPSTVDLQIVVEFPDSIQREITGSRLFVDDKLAVENKKAPFDRFTWNLDVYKETKTHALRVEVTDSQGMTGASTDLPIEVQVDAAPNSGAENTLQAARNSALMSLLRSRYLPIAAAVLISGIILAVVLILNERKNALLWKQRPARANGKTRQALAHNLAGFFDAAHARRNAIRPKDAKPQPGADIPASQVAARLVALDEHEQPITGGTIRISGEEMTFGSDPSRATQVLVSPTVAELHARLYHDAENHFYIADQGTVAGTWINYAPVTSHGARLEHGDLVHIGRLMFRFEIVEAGKARQPQVVYYGPEENGAPDSAPRGGEKQP